MMDLCLPTSFGLQQPHLTRSFDNLLDELLAEAFFQWADADEDGAWMCVSWRRVVLACSAAWSRV